jgi:SAM-dependent methyltransferase
VDELTGAESPQERESRVRHGSAFGAAAAAYAEHRPDYAEAAIRWALEPVRLREPLRVVDVGAGTGKLTAALVRLGAEVTAVEPDPRMLAQLRVKLPSVRSVPGSAEQIPLPDGSVDAVVAGQAMHWFDLDRAMPEIARVLVPGGVVAGLWNMDDDRVGWVAGLAQIRNRDGDATLLGWRRGAGRTRQERLAAVAPDLFDPVEAGEFGNGQPRTVDSLLATMTTHSDLLAMDEPQRTAMLARMRDFLRGQPETAAGEFVMPLVTVVLRTRRK